LIPEVVARQRLALALSLQGHRCWLEGRCAQLLEQGLLLEAEALDEEFRGLGQADQLLTMPTGLS
jgi:hypothetical protein